MLAAPAIMDTLNATGLTATLTSGGTVKITPASNLADGLCYLIRANKPQLMDWLRAANAPVPFDFWS